MPEELSSFSECFITGTAAEVTPVSEIGQYKFAIGDITRRLMDDFTALVHPAKAAVAAAGWGLGRKSLAACMEDECHGTPTAEASLYRPL